MMLVLIGSSSQLMTLCFDALGYTLEHVARSGGGRLAAEPGSRGALPGAGKPFGAAPWAVHGIFDGVRKPFDAARYVEIYEDLAAAFGADRNGALEHYLRYGLTEGRVWGPERGKEAGPDHLIIAAEEPSDEMQASWRESGAVLAVVLDNPVSVARHILAHGTATRREVVGRVSRSFALTYDLASRTGLPCITRTEPALMLDAMERVAAACGVPGARPLLQRYLTRADVQQWLAAEMAGEAHSAATATAGPSDASITEVLSGYADVLSQPLEARLSWPVDVFVQLDRPEETLGTSSSIDMTGPARCIVAGPYLCLPAGQWTCDVSFSVRENHRGCQFCVDVYQVGSKGDPTLAKLEFELPESGTFKLAFAFENGDPRLPIETRCHLREGVIGGRFQFLGAVLGRS